jgi:hypothetical protein
MRRKRPLTQPVNGYEQRGNMNLCRPRTIILIFAVIGALVLSMPGVRHTLLQAAGWALVANDAKRRVDVIVIAVDNYGAGVLEAVDLVHEGVSTRVAVFEDPVSFTDREFAKRGVPYYDAAALSVQQLHALGIRSVEVIPRNVAGSRDEAALLPHWCLEKGYRSLMLVTSADHSRRVRRMLQRTMGGSGIDAVVRASRYSGFAPDGWWYSRGGIRTEVVESEKLVLELVTHP